LNLDQILGLTQISTSLKHELDEKASFASPSIVGLDILLDLP
jgi:hypothetical protein